MAHVPLAPIGSPREAVLGDVDYRANLEAMGAREAVLTERRAEVAAGWGPKYVERVHRKGKLTTRERVERLADAGAPRLEVGTFVNYGQEFGERKLESPGAGVVTLFTRVAGRWVMVIANDNTVASGSWWPRTPEKIQRAQEMALRLRVPVVYLVDSSGLFLPEQSLSFPGATGGGHIFYRNAELSAAGVPQVAGVFGDCIAGGGYMPIISDRVIMTEQAYMVIAGAALIKGAKSQKMTSLDIGGPEVHVHKSGCADVRVPDDDAALRWIRQEVERLPPSAADYYRAGLRPSPPRFDPAELTGIVPTDHRMSYEAREVLARLVDDSLFWELWPRTGPEVITGVGRVGGLYAGFAINQPGLVPDPEDPHRERPGGILYREGIAKLAQFARACDADGLPLIWLQDVSGFDIGRDAEELGLLGWGSSLIYANTVQKAPVFTVLLRRASGAGYYAMSGRPFEPIVQLSTPISRLSVMEGRTLAIATYNTKLDDELEVATDDLEERREIEEGMRAVEARIEEDMDPYVSARHLDTDEVVRVGELRGWLEAAVELAYHTIGHRTVKNPRIWSLHDLERLGRRPPVPLPDVPCGVVREGEGDEAEVVLTSPGVGRLHAPLTEGAVVGPGTPVGALERAGAHEQLVVPPGVAGVVRGAPAAGQAVAHGEALLRIAPAGLEAAGGPAGAEDAATAERVLRAPQVGRFYHRPGPDQPAYVQPGDTLEPGRTVGLIEVMKTFFQVRVGDPNVSGGLSAPLEAVRYLVADGAEVDRGQPIVELD